MAVETQDKYLHNKKTWTRKIVILTDGENPMEVEDWEATVKKMNDLNIGLTVVCVIPSHVFAQRSRSHRGVDFDDDDFPFHEEDKGHIKVSFLNTFLRHQVAWCGEEGDQLLKVSVWEREGSPQPSILHAPLGCGMFN